MSFDGNLDVLKNSVRDVSQLSQTSAVTPTEVIPRRQVVYITTADKVSHRQVVHITTADKVSHYQVVL